MSNGSDIIPDNSFLDTIASNDITTLLATAHEFAFEFITGEVNEIALEEVLYEVLEENIDKSTRYWIDSILEDSNNARKCFFEKYKTKKQHNEGLPLMEIDAERRKPIKIYQLSEIRPEGYELIKRLAIFRLTLADPSQFKFDPNWLQKKVNFLEKTSPYNHRYVEKEKLYSGWESFSEQEKSKFLANLTFIYEAKTVEETLDANQIFLLEMLSRLIHSDLDLKVSKQIDETIWYLEKMGLSPQAIISIVNLLLAIQPLYRNKDQKVAISKRGKENEKEAAFNHFLAVIRTELGLIDMAQKNLEHLEYTSSQFYSTFNNKQHLVEACLLAVVHDVVEDGKITEDELYRLLEEHIKVVDRASGISGVTLLKNVFAKSKSLNTRYFPLKDSSDEPQHHENGKPRIDYRGYINNILESNDPVLILTKASDVLVNRRTNPNKAHTTYYTQEKEKVYIDFIYTLTTQKGLIPALPIRFIADIYNNYPQWREGKGLQCLRLWCGVLSSQDKEALITLLGGNPPTLIVEILNQ